MPRETETSNEVVGVFERTCPVCEAVFRTDDERTVYCSLKCKRKADNRRYYAARAEAISNKNNEHQKAQRKRLAEFENK